MTEPYYRDENVTVHAGDCLEVLAGMQDASVDSIVTDPPYDLTAGKRGGSGPASVNLNSPQGRARVGTGGFMGKSWDATGIAFNPETWAHCFRVLKPGGHLAAFGGTRTFHRMAVAIEDSGFEIRDSLAWLYGSGFPKSMNVGDGRGTALKPAFEPIVLARKPIRGTVAANVVEHGTGALNIDACRVEGVRDRTEYGLSKATRSQGVTYSAPSLSADFDATKGRFPANVLLDDTAAAELDEQSGHQRDGVHCGQNRDPEAVGNTIYGGRRKDVRVIGYGGEGGASRFFPVFKYTAKAPASERPSYIRDGAAVDTYRTRKRCTQCGRQRTNSQPSSECHCAEPNFAPDPAQQNVVAHPTVKPLELMRWLVRLLTPPGGLVLDPFAGSGTTAEACIHEHMRCITIEREAEYLPLIVARLTKPMAIGFNFEEPA